MEQSNEPNNPTVPNSKGQKHDALIVAIVGLIVILFVVAVLVATYVSQITR